MRGSAAVANSFKRGIGARLAFSTSIDKHLCIAVQGKMRVEGSAESRCDFNALWHGQMWLRMRGISPAGKACVACAAHVLKIDACLAWLHV